MRPGFADDIQQMLERPQSLTGNSQGWALTSPACKRLGLPQDDPRQHGVGFAVKNSLMPAIEPPTGGSEGNLAIGHLNIYNVLCIYAPTLCATPECKRRRNVSWRHPRSRHWHQLGLVITRRAANTRSFYSADCGRDRSLVGCKARLTAKKIHHFKTKGLPRTSTCRSNDRESSRRFQTNFSAKLDTSSFRPLTSTVDRTTSVMPYTPQPLLPHWDEMHPASETKRQAFLAYKQNPCISNHDALRAARSKAQQTARRFNNDYCLNMCSRIQTAADSGYARGMYFCIKTATGPTSITTAPLKSKAGELITDQGKQLDRWVQNYLERYATQNVVMDAALDALLCLPVIDELDVPASAEELGKAIDCLSFGRAPGTN
ncbi:unnamed protein product [Acanthosepion pharaonis]|uniref:Uncharacterized protein n=1 Tax=Acanthosepion pharaonis TaxID=158019 RepID=A0A812AQU1_ACAPH|nr:unnamed protein product [Sepia pharaonis]